MYFCICCARGYRTPHHGRLNHPRHAHLSKRNPSWRRKQYRQAEDGVVGYRNISTTPRLNISELLLADDFDVINKGAIAEQFVALELLKSFSPYRQENLYYWHRDAKSSNAEVDYLITKGSQIIPIEVKSGKKGTMQSLRIFMQEKQSLYRIWGSLENYAEYENIKVYPLYGIGELVSEQIGV